MAEYERPVIGDETGIDRSSALQIVIEVRRRANASWESDRKSSRRIGNSEDRLSDGDTSELAGIELLQHSISVYWGLI